MNGVVGCSIGKGSMLRDNRDGLGITKNSFNESNI